MEFQVGDVVVLTGDLSWESYGYYAPQTGMSGTVVDTDPGNDTYLLVNWDGYEDGHSGNTNEGSSHWWVSSSDVDLA